MSAIPDRWIEGEPTKPGVYLVRIDYQGNPWIYLFQCLPDFECSKCPSRLMYFNGHAGNRKSDPALYTLGIITSHCVPSAENFANVMTEIHARYNR